MNLDHADLEPQNLLDIRKNIGRMPWMQTATRDQAPGILFNIASNELVHLGGEANPLRRYIVDQYCAVHSCCIQVVEKRLWRATKLGDLLKVLAAFFDQFQGGAVEHF